MLNPIKFILALMTMLIGSNAYAVYPTLVLKNNFGEQTTNFVVGGSNQIDINFVIDSTNGNGFGVRSLKAPAGTHVYMHTSATPAAGNPNPAPGYVLVQLAADYLGYVTGFSGFAGPASGTPINITSGVTLGNPYIITSLGSTTMAQWEAVGLPLGITPNLGSAFIAAGATTGVGSGQVQAPAASGSGVDHVELVGDPNQTLNGTAGSWVLAEFLAATSSGVTTLQATAPANNSVVGMRFVMSQ